jgi:hypothetical protein
LGIGFARWLRGEQRILTDGRVNHCCHDEFHI